MFENQESTSCTSDESLEAFSLPQDWEEPQLFGTSEDFPIPFLFSGSPGEIPALEPAIDITVTSLSQADEGFQNQEEEKDVRSLVSMPGSSNVPREALDAKASTLVQFLLLMYKTNETFTQEDMLDVIGEYENQFYEILQIASERMELLFGIDLFEVNPIIHVYVLLNKLGITYDGMQGGTEDIPKIGLLIFVLGVVFMKGNHATEEFVWEMLNRMDIHSGQSHFLYGEPRKFITEELVLEGYLYYREVPFSDPPLYEFWLGPRAHAEINKIKSLEYLDKVNDDDCSTFSSLLKEALDDERKRIQIPPRI